MTTAIDFIALNAGLFPARVAIVDAVTRRRWSYREVDHAVAQGVAELKRHGVAPGDRVASLARNSVELIFLNFSCARLGALHVPLSWRLSPVELRAILAEVEPRLLLGDDSLPSAGLVGADLEEFARNRARRTAERSPPADPRRPSLILYTSGTRGLPKGAVLDETCLLATAANTADLCQVTGRTVFLTDAPMFHIIGLIVTIRSTLLQGGTVVVTPGFSADRTLACLADPTLGVTHYFCVPQVAAALRRQPAFDPAKLRQLTALLTGGAPHAAGHLRSWLADGVVVAEGYGMTECGTVFGMPLDRQLIERFEGSVGTAARGVSTRIVDTRDDECPPGEPGELLFKGASLMRGYWRNPGETRTSFTEDGWFRTGDLVVRDPTGYHWVAGRLKDMFISGGENVYPAEIERVVSSLPEIGECAVIGVPDDRWGEVGHLFVSPVLPEAFEPSRLAARLSREIAGFKIPRYLTVLDRLPRTGSGKVLKSSLRMLAAKPVEPPLDLHHIHAEPAPDLELEPAIGPG